MLNVACVRTGTKYPFQHVIKLKAMVEKYLPIPHKFWCLTDSPVEHEGIECVDISYFCLNGWWGKMALFERSLIPVDERILFFDLDTVIVDDLTPLAEWDGEFGICQNFQREAGRQFSCGYGSCVMSIGPWFGELIWDTFQREPEYWIERSPLGDQGVIEHIYPSATILQSVMPRGYFLHYKKLKEERPNGVSVVVFGGKSKPDNCSIEWVREEWENAINNKMALSHKEIV